MEPTIDISGIDKATLLKALYDASNEQGMGVFSAKIGGISIEEARELVAQNGYFDYLFGRVMKVDISGDFLRTRLYDRDLGEGAAADVVNKLRESLAK